MFVHSLVLVCQFDENRVQVTSSTGECQLGSQLQLEWLLLDSYSFYILLEN